jgi:hypothetical protein
MPANRFGWDYMNLRGQGQDILLFFIMHYEKAAEIKELFSLFQLSCLPFLSIEDDWRMAFFYWTQEYEGKKPG